MPNDIPQRVAGAINQSTLLTMQPLIRQPYNVQTVSTVNQRAGLHGQNPPMQPQRPAAPAPQPVQNTAQSPATPPPAPTVRDMVIPQLPNLLRKGQKAPLDAQNPGISRISLGFGWNVRDSRCDIDASAFLVTETGKVPGDDWFVFYGQDTSPDGSVVFSEDSTHTDRELITVDFLRLNAQIKKIIFVLTINEAFQNRLNFSMIKDPYVRIMDAQTKRVLLSYKMEDLYDNVTSMTIGELYLHNNAWKFNPVGNGVQQDLAGQCAIYGVAIE